MYNYARKKIQKNKKKLKKSVDILGECVIIISESERKRGQKQ